MRRRLLPAVTGLLLLTSGAWPATEESAQTAVRAAFGDVLPWAQCEAIVQFLSRFGDGSKLTIDVNGHGASFAVEGDEVRFLATGGGDLPPQPPTAPPETRETSATAPSPRPGPGRFHSALAIDLQKRMQLDPFHQHLIRISRKVVQASQEAVTFVFTPTDDEVTVTSNGTMCIRSPKPLDGLAIVDKLDAELQESLTYLRRVNNTIEDAQVGDAWAERRYFSDPPYTFKGVCFTSVPAGARPPASPGMVMGPGMMPGMMGAGDSGYMPQGFEAIIKIPRFEVLEARLHAELLAGAYDRLPTLRLDQKVIHEDKGWATGRVTQVAADVTDLLIYGEHRLLPEIRPYVGSRHCAFTVHIIAPPGTEEDFQVQALGETFTSLSSQPMASLTDMFATLQGLLPE